MTASVANTIDIPHITRAEIAARDKTPLEQLEMLRDLYALSGADNVDDSQLANWTAKSTVFDKLRPLLALQAKMARKQIVIDGSEINYWEGGNPRKPTLLLIHGFGACKENWGLLVRYLRDDYHLLVPDVAGFGESNFHFGCDYTLAAQADRLLQWLQRTNCGPVYAIGNSMGGAIAAQMAAQQPEHISRLCLMNAAGAPGSRMTLLELGLHAGDNYLIPNNRQEMLRLFNMATFNNRFILGRSLSLVTSTEMIHRSTINHHLFGKLVESLPDTYKKLPNIEAPTLVLWGDNDKVLDVTAADAFCDVIPSAGAYILPGTGHLPMLERPKQTAVVLDTFARELDIDSLISE